MFAAFASLAAQYLSSSNSATAGAIAGPSGLSPTSLGSGAWTVNFGKKQTSLAELPPWVVGAGIFAAAIVAVVAVKAIAK